MKSFPTKTFLLLSVWISAIEGFPDRDETMRSIGSSNVRSQEFLTTIRRQWSCVNGNCEETVIKCRNDVCDSTKNKFKAESYQPEIPEIVSTPFDFQSVAETFKFPNIPSVNIEAPFDNSGQIDLVANKNFAYYWSHSKQVNRKCENKICSVTTKTCNNGSCEEKTEQTTL